MNKEAFKVKKVKLVSNGQAVLIEYVNKYTHENDEYNDTVVVNCSRIPHPDLMNCFNKFKPHLAKVLGLDTFKVVLGSQTSDTMRKAHGTLEQSIELVYESILDKLKVHGLTVSGDNVVLTGAISCVAGGVVAVNTPSLNMEKENYGFEHDLAEQIEYLQKECYEYLFEKKSAQLEMDFNEEAA